MPKESQIRRIKLVRHHLKKFDATANRSLADQITKHFITHTIAKPQNTHGITSNTLNSDKTVFNALHKNVFK